MASNNSFLQNLHHPTMITICVMMATLMQVLDMTIASVALSHIQGSLSATQDQIVWVLTSYIVAAAIMMPLTGWLSHQFGRKTIFMIAIFGFTIASILCGMAMSLYEIVLFRILQGAFGAALIPLSQSTLLDTYPPEKHGSAMAIWGLGVVVGPILGPTIGGYFTEVYNWRWIFYINVPIGILSFIGIWLFVPETSPNRDRPFDIRGFLFLALAIGSFQLMLDRGNLKNWFDSGEIILEAIIAFVFFCYFLIHLLTKKHPFITPSLFLDRNFVAGLSMIFMMGIIVLATMALLPTMMQQLYHYPVMTTGLILAPRGIGSMIAMALAGRLINRFDIRHLILFGLSIIGLALYQMTLFDLMMDKWLFIYTGILQGFGMGFVIVVLSTATFITLHSSHRTEAASLYSLSRSMGSSIGVSAFVTLLNRKSQMQHSYLSEHITDFNKNFSEAMINESFLKPEIALKLIDGEVTRQSTMIAYLYDFQVMSICILFMIPFVFLFQKTHQKLSMDMNSK